MKCNGIINRPFLLSTTLRVSVPYVITTLKAREGLRPQRVLAVQFPGLPLLSKPLQGPSVFLHGNNRWPGGASGRST